MNRCQTRTEQKQIVDLTLNELDMIYSLARIGNWQNSDIARVYGLSESDVRRVFSDYVELRRVLEIHSRMSSFHRDHRRRSPGKCPVSAEVMPDIRRQQNVRLYTVPD
jgi:hypothetical protein